MQQMDGEIKLSAVPLGALSHLLFGENSQSEGRAGGISDDGIRDNGCQHREVEFGAWISLSSFNY